MSSQKGKQKYRHGLRGDPLYGVWRSMRNRCNNPNAHEYHRYGGRGIKVCDEWDNPSAFINWAHTNGYAQGLEIDRIDNNRGYSPDNCRFVSRKENIHNSTTSVNIEIDGKTRCLSDWAREYGYAVTTVVNWYRTHGEEYVKDRIKEDYLITPNHPVHCTELNKDYRSVQEAANAIEGCTRPGISAVCCGLQKSHRGLHFNYIYEKAHMKNNIDLYDHQVDAVRRLHNGAILAAPVGVGKSRTALAYYYFKIIQGSMRVNGKGRVWLPKFNIPLIIITTAKKRDSKEWDDELNVFGIKATAIDSWNNIKKYVTVTDAFFVFDEDRVVGSGAWVKSFLKIAKHNRWILLSATPGDSWQDYIPVFIANGFYKNRTEFNRLHTVYKPYMKFPVVDHYINTEVLENYRRQVLVIVDYQKKAVKENHKIIVNYDKTLYKRVFKDRWDIFEDEPVMEAGKLCYLLRKVVNIDNSRVEAVRDLLLEHEKAIIFYNFTYELNILRELANTLGYDIGEWNGEVHSEVPTTSRWVYLAQYTAASEGWNCITTDTTIFYSQSYSYRTTIQAAGRIDRLNTPFSTLHYYYIRSAAPIDLAIARALNQKKDFNARAYVGGFK